MAKKIICESCGTIFEYKIAKDFEVCPVCKASFDDDVEESIELDEDADELEEAVMYFDQIMIFKSKPEYNHVFAYCQICKKTCDLDLDMFDELVDKDHVTLKKDAVVKCRGCGREHKPRKIMYKLKDHYAPRLPRCPVCNSAMLKKITVGNKLVAAAALGAFAIPYTGKTYECKDCGHRF